MILRKLIIILFVLLFLQFSFSTNYFYSVSDNSINANFNTSSAIYKSPNDGNWTMTPSIDWNKNSDWGGINSFVRYLPRRDAMSDTNSDNGKLFLGNSGTGDSIEAKAFSVIKDGGIYKMWYTGGDGTNYRIYLATSIDGLIWTKYDNSIPADSNTTGTNGRIPLGLDGSGDDYFAFSPYVIKDEGIYKMWYSGYDGARYRIFYATSPDGLTWTKYNNSIPDDSDTTGTDGRIPRGTTGKGDFGNVYNPVVIKNDSNYLMYYAGSDGTNYRIYFATSPDGLTWTKYDNSTPAASSTTSTNGRIPLGLNGSGDDVHLLTMSIIKDGNIFRLWYQAHYGSAWAGAYQATSPDGLTWTKVNNVLATRTDTTSTDGKIAYGGTTDGVGDYGGIYGGAIIQEDDNSFKAWYAAFDGSIHYRTFYATSPDGLTWTKYDNSFPGIRSDTTSFNGKLVEGTVGTGDDDYIHSKSVIKDGNEYKMWYTGSDGTNYTIFYATSPDGKVWTKYDNSIEAPSNTTGTNGRIPLGLAGSGDDDYVMNPSVILDNGTYKMWYSGYDGGAGGYRIYYATSPDGLTWTKYNNSIPDNSDTTSTDGRIPKGTSGMGDDYFAYAPSVIKDGSTYKMWYTGYNQSAARYAVYYATSPDGLTWTKYDNTYLSENNTTGTNGRLPVGTNNKADDVGAYNPAVIKDGDVYKMWYQAYDGSNNRIAYAYSSDGLTWTKQNNDVPTTNNFKGNDGRVPLTIEQQYGGSSHMFLPAVIKDGDVYKMWLSSYEARGAVYVDYLEASDGLWDENLIAYFNFDNNVTTEAGTAGKILVVPDLARGNDAIVAGANPYLREGLFDSNSFYSAISGYLKFEDWVSNQPTSELTISFWMKPYCYYANTSRKIISKWDGTVAGTDNGAIMLETDNGVGGTCGIKFSIYNSADTKVSTPATGKIFSERNWYHINAVFKDGNMIVYVDGNVIASQDFGEATIPDSSFYWGIGEDGSGTGDLAEYFYGYLDEIKIYKRALSQQEIINDYQSFSNSKLSVNLTAGGSTIKNWNTIKVNKDVNYSFGTEICGQQDSNCSEKWQNGLIGLWHFNNSTDTNDSASTNHFTQVGFDGNEAVTGLWDTNAYYFDGNDALTFNGEIIDLSSDPTATVSMWVKFNSLTSTDTLFAMSDNLSSSYFQAFREGQTLAWYERYNSGTIYQGRINYLYSGAYAYNPLDMNDFWYHIVLVRNGTAHPTVYVNSVRWGSVTAITSFNNSVQSNSQQVNIGRANATNPYPANMVMEEFAIWDRQLTQEEITELYRKGVSRLDINAFSCSDQNCNVRTSTKNLTKVKNNYEESLSGLAPSEYFGFDVLFRQADGFGGKQIATDYGAFFSDVNISDTLSAIGRIKTLKDNNAESYFSEGETITIQYDANLASNPLITITDSLGTTLVSDESMTLSASPDYNSFTYDFNIAGEIGWCDVSINGQPFANAFYNASLWGDVSTDADARIYPFTFDLNITEPNMLDRYFYPMDTNLNFTYNAKPNSIRLLDYNGTHYREIPFQLYSQVFSGNYIASTRIVFPMTIERGATKNYAISYSTADYNAPIYDSALQQSYSNGIYTFDNDYYQTSIDINENGLIKSIASKYGTSGSLQTGILHQRVPEIKTSTTTYNVRDISSIDYNLDIDGNIFKKLRITGSNDIYNYILTYKFYEKAPYYIIDTNITPLSNVYWDYYYSMDAYYNPSMLTKGIYLQSGLPNTFDVTEGTVVTGPVQDINYIAFYKESSFDGIGDAFLNTSFSKTPYLGLTVYDLSGETSARMNAFKQNNVTTTDYFNSSRAKIVFETLRNYEDMNSTFYSIKNPLTLVAGSTRTTDPTPPVNISVTSTPADANDQQDINCSSTWSDNTLIDTIRIIVTGPNISLTDTDTILDANGSMTYIIDANKTNAGTITCLFTATDIAGNDTNASTSFLVSDFTAPFVYLQSTNPDTNAGIDPDMIISIDANINEYTSLSSVTLFTRNSNDGLTWSDWSSSAMSYDSNSSDYNLNYTASLAMGSDEKIWQYFVNAIDINGYDSNSETQTFHAYWDWTWTSSPADFGLNSSTGLGATVDLGNITIVNTGDKSLDFKLTSNWTPKTEIDFNSTDETLAGFLFTLAVDSNTIIPVTLTSKTTERSDSLTITINATDANASPDYNTITATIVSASDGPFLYTEIIDYNAAVTQGATDIIFTGRVTNAGNDNATDVTFDWNIPSDWLVTSGEESGSYSGTLSVGNNFEKTIYVTIDAVAELGEKTITFSSSCCSDSNKTRTASQTVTVVSSSTTIIDEGDEQTGGGATGGASGSGEASGGGSIFVGEQSDLFFQTNDFFELVRGEDNSFAIKFENPLSNKLIDIELSVEGIISKYLRLKNTSIKQLDSNQTFDTSIEIISPKYFTPGTYSLKFIIEGTLIGDYNRETKFKEEREIKLVIHDTNQQVAESYLEDMNSYIFDLNNLNLNLKGIPSLLKQAQAALDNREFDEVAKIFDEAKKLYEEATEATLKTKQITGLVGLANSKGISTPNTDRLLMLAQLALQRGDYALALSRLKEAELMYSIETKGEFNLFIWAIANIDKVLLMIGLTFIAAYMFILGIKIVIIKRKLKLLASENNLLLSLIKNLQNQCFVENKISIGEYYDALTQYEERMAIVSEDMIEYTSRKNNLLKFASSVKRLSQERDSLLDLIKETQKQYFDLGLIETRIYTTKLNSLTKRMSEVQEAIVSHELRKTQRLNEGLKKHIWKIIYKIMK